MVAWEFRNNLDSRNNHETRIIALIHFHVNKPVLSEKCKWYSHVWRKFWIHYWLLLSLLWTWKFQLVCCSHSFLCLKLPFAQCNRFHLQPGEAHIQYLHYVEPTRWIYVAQWGRKYSTCILLDFILASLFKRAVADLNLHLPALKHEEETIWNMSNIIKENWLMMNCLTDHKTHLCYF